MARADGSGPALVGVGATGAGYRAGSVWLAHVAFSGAHRLRLERSSTGIGYLGGGELLAPGEIRLAGGAAYHTPWVCGAWGDGLDAAAGRFHDQLRTGRERPAKPHPIVFDASGPAFADHDQHALPALAEYAAAVGAEAIVLDVGWCTRVGLDPYADSDSGGHPNGWTILNVCSRGSAGTVSSRASPSRRRWWRPTRRSPPSTRSGCSPQRRGPRAYASIDLAIRPAMVHVWERLTKLLDRHQLGYLVWLCDPTSTPARGYQGEPTVHARTLATYRLLDALRERYPQLQIQARQRRPCAGNQSAEHDRGGAERHRWHARCAG